MFSLVGSTLCSRDVNIDKSIYRKTLEAFEALTYGSREELQKLVGWTKLATKK